MKACENLIYPEILAFTLFFPHYCSSDAFKTLDSSAGLIGSPYWPSSYGSNKGCEWLIKFLEKRYILVYFFDVDMDKAIKESERTCLRSFDDIVGVKDNRSKYAICSQCIRCRIQARIQRVWKILGG